MLPEGWRKENINSVTEKVGSGITPKGGNAVYKKQGIQFLRSQNVQWGKLSLDDVAFIDDTQHNRMKSTAVKYGDVLLNITGASIGRSGAYNSHKEANVNQHVCIIRSNGKIDHNYLVNFLISPYGQKQIDQFQAGGNRQGLNFEQIKSLKISLPPLPEQKKIAAILSTWDRAIEGTEQLLANSQQQKKALMQQLLTGKKRLPGFTGEWKNVLLKDIALIKKGQALSSKDLIHGEYPVIAGGKTSPYTHKHFTHENVITVSASGAYAGYVSFHSYKIWASDCSVITSRSGNSISFIYFWLSYLQNKIFSLQSGGAQPHIYPRDLELLHIHCPPLPEQKAIAAVLSTADEEITALESDLSRLHQEKKALMQQLLTGKRRVTVD